MRIKFGYELAFNFPQPTPLMLMLHAHPSRIHDLIRPDDMRVAPHVSVRIYHDGFGNTCTRIEAPAGRIAITSDGLIEDSGMPEPAYPFAQEHPVSLLPEEAMAYLQGSHYCDLEAFKGDAWRRFGHLRPGWSRVQAICSFAHEHVMFGYQFARPVKTAWQAYTEQQGGSRDFTHLAITLCRCMNIPARYCTGYLGNIRASAEQSTMDFAGWFEAYLGGAWHTFDPTHNERRIGRILVARGRDAGDVPISTTFGPNYLETFRVWADEVSDAGDPAAKNNSYLDERYGHAT